jgi:hypothetical protein
MKLDLDQFSGESQSSESLQFENMDDNDVNRKASYQADIINNLTNEKNDGSLKPPPSQPLIQSLTNTVQTLKETTTPRSGNGGL